MFHMVNKDSIYKMQCNYYLHIPVNSLKVGHAVQHPSADFFVGTINSFIVQHLQISRYFCIVMYGIVKKSSLELIRYQ